MYVYCAAKLGAVDGSARGGRKVSPLFEASYKVLTVDAETLERLDHARTSRATVQKAFVGMSFRDGDAEQVLGRFGPEAWSRPVEALLRDAADEST